MPYAKLADALAPITSRVRTDITAIKTADGRQAWTKEPLTPERMARHLNGGPARGVCPIKAGESVTMVGLLDFDSHGGETAWPEMLAVAGGVMDVLEMLGAYPIAFKSSGGRGVHVYCLWEAPQDAYSVRKFLEGALGTVGLKSGVKGVIAGEVEIFPKQDTVPLDGNGSQFILPLAGASVPLELCDLVGGLVEADGGRAAVLGMDWPLSHPVPVVVRPARDAGGPGGVAGGVAGALACTGVSDELRAALDVLNIEDDLDYDQWRNVVFALHHETGGSAEGLRLAHEVSARSMKYDPDFLDSRVWPYVRSQGRDAAVTGRTIMALARTKGWVEGGGAAAFEVLCPTAEGGPNGLGGGELPPFTRKKSGAIVATMTNAVMALRRPDLIGWRIGHDTFKDDITLASADCRGLGFGAGWRPIRDADMVDLRMRLESLGFESAPKEMARDAVAKVAEEYRYDSAIVWLEGLEKRGWDRVARCETFFIDYFGCEDTPYIRAVGTYLWSALAGRVLDPGCQVDMVPILEGAQGLRKSTAVAALVPGVEFFAEIDFADREENTARRMRGVLVGEIAELRGLNTRDEDAIKKFITRRHENWIPKFKEFSTTFPRRLVLIATVNPKTSGFLGDETGHRRWLPVPVARANVEGIVSDREQLWAEAAALWRANGVVWGAVEGLAGAEHERYTVDDEWQGVIEAWVAGQIAARGDESDFNELSPIAKSLKSEERTQISLIDVATGALGFAVRDVGGLVQRRIGAVLRKMGYTKHVVKIAGKNAKVWRNSFYLSKLKG